MGMVVEACLPSNAYYPRTPDYTLYSGVHVCWSEHSNLSFVYGFMSLDYGLGTMTATTSFGITEPILVILKTEYRLSQRWDGRRGGGGGAWGGGRGAYAALQTTVLHMKRPNQTVSPIFVILFVLCFQRQSFFTFILLYCSWCCAVWRL